MNLWNLEVKKFERIDGRWIAYTIVNDAPVVGWIENNCDRHHWLFAGHAHFSATDLDYFDQVLWSELESHIRMERGKKILQRHPLNK